MESGAGGVRAERACSFAASFPLLTVLLALIAGICTDRQLVISLSAWSTVVVLSWSGWMIGWWRSHDRTATVLLLLAIASFGGAWHHLRWRLFPRHDVALLTAIKPAPLCCEGIVLAAPVERAPSAHSPLAPARPRQAVTFPVRVTRIRDGQTWRDAVGCCSVDLFGGGTAARPGDQVRIWGHVEGIARPRNPGVYDFAVSQRGVRRLRRIRANHPAAVQIQVRSGNASPWWLLARFRQRGSAALRRYMPRPSAEVAAAILLGERAGLGSQRAHAFLLTGTAHLLAISGLHVGILAGAVLMLGRSGFVSRRWTQMIVVLFVTCYALITDAQPPVVRAAVLISMLAAGQFWGRQATPANTLAAAGIVVLLINPASLFRLGTQLSFLAVTALIVVAGRRRELTAPKSALEQLIARARPWHVRWGRRYCEVIGQLFLTTMWIWLTAAPLVAFRFHLVTPVALLINTFLAIPIALALLTGFGVVLVGDWLPAVAGMLGACCDVCLRFCEASVLWAARLPGGHVWVPSPPLWWVILFYIAGAGWVLFARRRLSALMCWAFVVGWVLVAALVNVDERDVARQDGLICTFIAVGHGTSVLLELPDGQVWLYDAGRLGSPDVAVRRIAAVLWDRGIVRLDAVFLSHADIDHYNALPGLLDRFTVGAVYTTPVMFSGASEAITALRSAIARYRIPLHELSRGDHMSFAEGFEFDVLHPSRHGSGGGDNADSLVLRIEYQGRTVILPGDLESPGSADVWSTELKHCDLLMAPHHGSPRSEPAKFLGWANPDWVVVSGGGGAKSLASQVAYGQRGAGVSHTDAAGAVRVQVLRRGLRIESWRSRPW